MFKGNIISSTSFELEELIIGRDFGCTIQIDSLAIAPKHLKINHEQEGYVVTALNDQFPLTLDHKRVETATLKHGDLLQIGKHSLEFIDDGMSDVASPSIIQNVAELKRDEEPPKEPSRSNLTGILQILSGSNIGRVIPLNRPLIKIGKSGEACAVIAYRKSGYHLSFLEGATPPKVNQQSIVDHSYLLKNGDQIEFGDTSMYFQETAL
ncbi:MAG: FHA domain-containing protein [Candidatus Polarisedimenticolaceae bacterium]|nr:FHA domain-containing protein [Candidatus Polarisedimenticolaceae bacterium]